MQEPPANFIEVDICEGFGSWIVSQPPCQSWICSFAMSALSLYESPLTWIGSCSSCMDGLTSISAMFSVAISATLSDPATTSIPFSSLLEAGRAKSLIGYREALNIINSIEKIAMNRVVKNIQDIPATASSQSAWWTKVVSVGVENEKNDWVDFGYRHMWNIYQIGLQMGFIVSQDKTSLNPTTDLFSTWMIAWPNVVISLRVVACVMLTPQSSAMDSTERSDIRVMSSCAMVITAATSVEICLMYSAPGGTTVHPCRVRKLVLVVLQL